MNDNPEPIYTSNYHCFMKTAEELYQSFVDEIFGKDVLSIPLNGKSNPVIGSLSHPNEFLVFKKNFKERLIRLKGIYETRSSDYTKLLEKVKNVALENNWEGAYSELVALDVLNKGLPCKGIELDKAVEGEKCFARECGKDSSDEDGYWEDFDAFFDVKTFSDPILGILNNAVISAKKQAGITENFSVLFSYDADRSADEIQRNVGHLISELKSILPSKPRSFSSKVVPNLEYSLLWTTGINSGETTYDPYRHAMNSKDIILSRYAAKFVKRKPTFIIMVHFPWFKEVVSSFDGMNKVFYRALSRRTFCGYLHSNAHMNELISSYSSTTTVRNLSKHLTGVIFIEDESIKKDSASCYVFLNPNAKNSNRSQYPYLLNLASYGDDGLYDDMKYDNY